MNVFYGRTFIGYVDNSQWGDPNKDVHYPDIGFDHISAYWAYLEEIANGKTYLYGRRSDEGTLA